MKSTWSFCRSVDGVFTGARISCDASFVEANTPPGCSAVEGAHDHLCRRIDLTTGQVVPYQPPPPPDDELQTWRWDATNERWLSVATDAAVAAQVRAERTRRTDAFAWRYERHAREVRLGLTPTDSLAALDAHMQALADVPLQAGFPRAVIWPEEPML